MTVAVLLVTESDVTQLISWGAYFARASETDLLVLRVQRHRSQGEVADVSLEQAAPATGVSLAAEVRTEIQELPFPVHLESQEEPGDDSETAGQAEPPLQEVPLRVRMKRISSSLLTDAILQELMDSDVSLLIIPRHAPLQGIDAGATLERQLFLRAPCETMYLRAGNVRASQCDKIMVPTAGGPHADVALSRAAEFALSVDGQVTALFVEPEVDEVAVLVGERIIDRIVRRIADGEQDHVIGRVTLADELFQGISGLLDESFELVLLGTTNHSYIRKMLFTTVKDQALYQGEGPAVAVVRSKIPWSSRVRRLVEHRLQSFVPQLDRNDRVSLVERIQLHSRWDFDFIALICLSTLIAGLGLARDSAAVVIGAMLVAPLMTPLVGAGLALVQGNFLLLSNAGKTILRGFLLAFLLGWLLGICLPTLDITDEMRARGSPHVLDLLVAFISGIAAAYAIGRPNLSSALPGVAIAAALVPPVATAGLAAAGWEWRLAGGSLLLFLTNIVAIILGTACSLWLVGIRDSHRHGTVQRWSRPLSWSLCLLAVFLAIYESLPSAPVPNRLRQQIQTTVEKVIPEGQVVHIRRQARRNPVEMTVEVATPRTDVEDLHPQLIQVISQYYDRPVVLRLEFHWVRIGRSNSSVLP
ncbi:MAG: DUF389 domain-containing protein [Pirellulaceae bacterium]